MTIIVPDPPTGNSAAMRVQRKNTEAYIKANPTEITLMRGIKTPDGAGGKRTTRTALGFTQQVRMIQAEERGDIVERRNSDGENVRPLLNMLCVWDADVVVGDQFTWKDNQCEVVYITDLNYELTCEVAVR